MAVSMHQGGKAQMITLLQTNTKQLKLKWQIKGKYSRRKTMIECTVQLLEQEILIPVDSIKNLPIQPTSTICNKNTKLQS